MGFFLWIFKGEEITRHLILKCIVERLCNLYVREEISTFNFSRKTFELSPLLPNNKSKLNFNWNNRLLQQIISKLNQEILELKNNCKFNCFKLNSFHLHVHYFFSQYIFLTIKMKQSICMFFRTSYFIPRIWRVKNK